MPLVVTCPLFTLALSAPLLRDEKLGRRVLLGVALTLAGVVLLVRPRGRRIPHGRPDARTALQCAFRSSPE